MDLTKDYPRSPREKLDGMMLLPRAIDKARAQVDGKLGEYIYYGCRFNRRLFDTFGVTDDEFLDAVRTAPDDDAVLEWVRDFVRPEPEKVEAMNRWVEDSRPAPTEREEFSNELERVDPGNDSIETWADLIDLEEGRLTKESSTAT